MFFVNQSRGEKEVVTCLFQYGNDRKLGSVRAKNEEYKMVVVVLVCMSLLTGCGGEWVRWESARNVSVVSESAVSGSAVEKDIVEEPVEVIKLEKFS